MKRFVPWLCGILAATLLFAALAAFFSFRYENSDDILFVKDFMGFEGQSSSFTLYTHTWLAWALHALSVLWPAVAWFSLFQLGLLWLSCAVIVKSLMQIARNHSLSMLWGALAGLMYLGVFAAFACCRLSYTSTAALAGAAAVVQLLSVDHRDKAHVYRGFALSALLLALCYSLRQIALLPPLAFWLLAFLWQLWAVYGFGKKRPIKPMLACLCALAVALSALAAVREVEISARNQREYLRWQTARISLFDYTSFERDIAPALEADSGMTDAQIALLREWYFMDGNTTADALDAIRAAYEGESAGLADVPARVKDFLGGNGRYSISFALCALLMLLCLCRAKGRGAAYALAAVLCALGGAALTAILAYQGRLIYRSVDSALFPCAGMLLALALAGFGRGEADLPAAAPRLLRATAVILCLCCLTATGYHVLQTKQALSAAPDTVSMQREDELEAYALANPDKLIVRTPNLLRDTRLMPDVSAGTPTNLMIWGDWYCRTPTWNAQLKRFGFTIESFSAADWLSDTLLFATVDDAPPQALADYVAEGAGAAVKAKLYGEYGTLRFFRFATE